MKNIIGMSTGALKGMSFDLNQTINFLSSLNCNAIELTFEDLAEFYNYVPDKNAFKFFNRAEYLSLHFPFKFRYRGNAETEKLIYDVCNFGKRYNVKNFTLHPSRKGDVEESFGNKFAEMNISFENCRKRNALETYKRLYRTYRTKWVFDTTHALAVSSEHFDELVSWFSEEKNLVQIHLSDYQNAGSVKTHQPIANNLSLVNRIKGLQVPIIIEATYAEISSLVNDFEFVNRNFL